METGNRSALTKKTDLSDLFHILDTGIFNQNHGGYRLLNFYGQTTYRALSRLLRLQQSAKHALIGREDHFRDNSSGKELEK